MPELPELEVMIENLLKKVKGLSIVSIEELDDKGIKGKLALDKNLGLIKNIKRYGKYIAFRTEKIDFYIHLMLSGKLIISDSKIPFRSRVVLKLSNGANLFLTDKRRLAYLGIDIKDMALGIDPFNKFFTVEALTTLIETENNMKLKSFLMDQDLIAGIGNAYSDEIMYYAKLNPARRVGELSKKEINTLFESILYILKKAIKEIKIKTKDEIELDDEKLTLFVHRKKDQKCPKGDGNITTIKVDGKNSYYCPTCQK
jgi:formamidopyrimidine-DNA glycosylase